MVTLVARLLLTAIHSMGKRTFMGHCFETFEKKTKKPSSFLRIKPTMLFRNFLFRKFRFQETPLSARQSAHEEVSSRDELYRKRYIQ